jgi:hypothetical protein
MGVMMSSTPIATLLLSSDGHDNVTMHVTIVPVYKELDTVPPPPSSSSDMAQCESRLFVRTVAKKIEKRGGGFVSILLGIDSRR